MWGPGDRRNRPEDRLSTSHGSSSGRPATQWGRQVPTLSEMKGKNCSEGAEEEQTPPTPIDVAEEKIAVTAALFITQTQARLFEVLPVGPGGRGLGWGGRGGKGQQDWEGGRGGLQLPVIGRMGWHTCVVMHVCRSVVPTENRPPPLDLNAPFSPLRWLSLQVLFFLWQPLLPYDDIAFCCRRVFVARHAVASPWLPRSHFILHRRRLTLVFGLCAPACYKYSLQ